MKKKNKKKIDNPNFLILATKVDSLMTLLFEYFSLIKIHHVNNNIDDENMISSSKINININDNTTTLSTSLSDQTFISLLRVFHSKILVTYQSRFTQFLIFYYCSLKSLYCQAFIKSLIEKLYSTDVYINERISCASYLSSFLARAVYIPQATVLWAWELLFRWLINYIHQDNQHNTTYY